MLPGCLHRVASRHDCKLWEACSAAEAALLFFKTEGWSAARTAVFSDVACPVGQQRFCTLAFELKQGEQAVPKQGACTHGQKQIAGRQAGRGTLQDCCDMQHCGRSLHSNSPQQRSPDLGLQRSAAAPRFQLLCSTSEPLEQALSWITGSHSRCFRCTAES